MANRRSPDLDKPSRTNDSQDLPVPRPTPNVTSDMLRRIGEPFSTVTFRTGAIMAGVTLTALVMILVFR